MRARGRDIQAQRKFDHYQSLSSPSLPLYYDLPQSGFNSQYNLTEKLRNHRPRVQRDAFQPSQIQLMMDFRRANQHNLLRIK